MSLPATAIAEQFCAGHRVAGVTPLGDGLINDTFLVSSTDDSFVLQRINAKVFPQPRQVIENLQRLIEHVGRKPPASVRLQIPRLLPNLNGDPYFQDSEGQFWRALQRIHPAECRNRISSNGEAAAIGSALAHFHRLCSDLSPALLHDTLPGFHVAPLYFEHYQDLLAKMPPAQDAEIRHCQDFIQARRPKIGILEQARNIGELTERVIHGDPKLNNFLFRPESEQIVSLIDLDTVKPGLVHYDIGDCIRSCCHDKSNGSFDLNRCDVILRHYLAEAADFFGSYDYEYLYAAIWLIPFELGLRFFHDYLNGNQYFKTSTPRQNLERAQSQFTLCRDIEHQQADLQRCIDNAKAISAS